MPARLIRRETRSEIKTVQRSNSKLLREEEGSSFTEQKSSSIYMLLMKMFRFSAAAKHNKHIPVRRRVTLDSPNLRNNPRIPQITAGPVILSGVLTLNPTYEPIS